MIVKGFFFRSSSMAILLLGLTTEYSAAQENTASNLAEPETPASIDTNVSNPTADQAIIVAAGTMIQIQIDEAINSKSHKTGDWYAISLTQPIMLGERILVPAGTLGRGQVVHSAKSGWGGKAGELILAARYLEYEDQQIPLRAMKLGTVGENNETLALATSVAGGIAAIPLVFALNGKNADISAGTLATAKLAQPLPNTVTPSVDAVEAAPAPTEPQSIKATEEQEL